MPKSTSNTHLLAWDWTVTALTFWNRTFEDGLTSRLDRPRHHKTMENKILNAQKLAGTTKIVQIIIRCAPQI